MFHSASGGGGAALAALSCKPVVMGGKGALATVADAGSRDTGAPIAGGVRLGAWDALVTVTTAALAAGGFADVATRTALAGARGGKDTIE